MPVRIQTVTGSTVRELPDRLATEEPMEIRIQGPRGDAQPVAVTMRTPGNDFELAVGFLLTERVLDNPSEIVSVAYCLEGKGEQHYNVVTVRTRSMPDPDRPRRSFAVNASCGLCGKTTLDEIAVACAPVADGPVIPGSVLLGMPTALRDAQALFDETGGLHAAACFDSAGQLVVVREDIGRHNAVDKVVGEAALDGRLPLAQSVLLVSGRVSFEIVQKAAVAGVPIVAAVSAPSSLAIEAATRLGQTIVGFLRDDRYNVYSGADRIDTAR